MASIISPLGLRKTSIELETLVIVDRPRNRAKIMWPRKNQNMNTSTMMAQIEGS